MNTSYSSILLSCSGVSPRSSGLPRPILEQIGQLRVFQMYRETVAKAYDLEPHQLCQCTRTLPIREARQVAMALGHKHLGIIQSQVGQQLGGKDHSTVWYACKVVSDLNSSNRKFRERLKVITDSLQIKMEGLL